MLKYARFLTPQTLLWSNGIKVLGVTVMSGVLMMIKREKIILKITKMTLLVKNLLKSI